MKILKLNTLYVMEDYQHTSVAEHTSDAEQTSELFTKEDFPDGLTSLKKELKREKASLIATNTSKMNTQQEKSRRRQQRKHMQNEITTMKMIHRCDQILDEIRDLDKEGPVICGYFVHLDSFTKVPPKYQVLKSELLELSRELKKLGIDYLYRAGTEDDDIFGEDDGIFDEDDDIFGDHE